MEDPFAGTSYDQFKKKILALTSLDLDIYRQPQLQRRLQSLLKKMVFQPLKPIFSCLWTILKLDSTLKAISPLIRPNSSVTPINLSACGPPSFRS